MKKIKNGLKMIGLFFRLVFEMIKNYPALNDDMENNYFICQKICRKILHSAHIQLNLYGTEYVKQKKPFLLVSNHRCFFDVVVLMAAVETPISFVAARELFSYPILRKYLSSMRCVMLDRYTEDLAQIKKNVNDMGRALKERSVALFPEGECSYHDPEMKKFKKGGFVVVSRVKAFVVPAFIQIASIHNIGRWMIPQGEVAVWFGKGFYPEEAAGKRVQGAELASYTQERVKELRKTAESKEKINNVKNSYNFVKKT